jgi:hypothetical protein
VYVAVADGVGVAVGESACTVTAPSLAPPNTELPARYASVLLVDVNTKCSGVLTGSAVPTAWNVMDARAKVPAGSVVKLPAAKSIVPALLLALFCSSVARDPPAAIWTPELVASLSTTCSFVASKSRWASTLSTCWMPA